MKRFIVLLVFVLSASSIMLEVTAQVSTQVVAQSSPLLLAQSQSKYQTVLFQTNLRCDKCRVNIEDSLPFERGVKDVVVDVAAKKVAVTYDASRTNPDNIRKALEKLGYNVEIVDTTKKEK